jgi:sodium/bile acid cotransporter 7
MVGLWVMGRSRGKRPAWFDPFIFSLLTAVLLASCFPARGNWAVMISALADAGIILLFFLHGARLSREAILSGLRHWRLHLLVIGATFGLFPLLGLGISHLPFLSPAVATGMLFLTLLPSTVQSSIAFTSLARGNVPAAVCTAALSNLLGIFLSPALVLLLMQSRGGMPVIGWSSVLAILGQLLLPFLLGHLCRPWIAAWVSRNRQVLTVIDRGSIVLVVYSAFGAAVAGGLWANYSFPQLAMLGLLCALLLGLIMSATWGLARLAGFDWADCIVVQFCGSKKSLASGVPMAGVLFPAVQVGMIILPLMLFHQIQLMLCAIMARHYGSVADGSEDEQKVALAV